MLQFNALTGPELKSVILKEIENKLDETGEFAQHRTFPWVKLTIGAIKVLAYPKQGMEDEPEIQTPQIEKVLSEKDAPQPDEQPSIIDLGSYSLVIDTPDKARDEAGLPIPVPGIADVGGVAVPTIVDKYVSKKSGK